MCQLLLNILTLYSGVKTLLSALKLHHRVCLVHYRKMMEILSTLSLFLNSTILLAEYIYFCILMVFFLRRKIYQIDLNSE